MAGFAAALKAAESSTIASVQLRGAPLGPGGAAAIAPALASLGALTTLGLGSCRIGDRGVKAIVEALLVEAAGAPARVKATAAEGHARLAAGQDPPA